MKNRFLPESRKRPFRLVNSGERKRSKLNGDLLPLVETVDLKTVRMPEASLPDMASLLRRRCLELDHCIPIRSHYNPSTVFLSCYTDRFRCAFAVPHLSLGGDYAESNYKSLWRDVLIRIQNVKKCEGPAFEATDDLIDSLHPRSPSYRPPRVWSLPPFVSIGGDDIERCQLNLNADGMGLLGSREMAPFPLPVPTRGAFPPPTELLCLRSLKSNPSQPPFLSALIETEGKGQHTGPQAAPSCQFLNPDKTPVVPYISPPQLPLRAWTQEGVSAVTTVLSWRPLPAERPRPTVDQKLDQTLVSDTCRSNGNHKFFYGEQDW